MTGGLMENNQNPIHQLRPALSIIVPILNEIELLPELMTHLQYWQRRGCEILLVDGGSDDGSADVAEAIGFKVIRSVQGRASQMNAGAAQAKGTALLFLHADTRMPNDGLEQISSALKGHLWGRFDIRISGDALMLTVIAFFMNMRSRLTGIATGDQAIFVQRELFEKAGGFTEQLLMEDIELSKQLRKVNHPACLCTKVTTSGRRWLTHGLWHTVLLMWRLRWAYWRGVSVEKLAKEYF
jgi:rSAM/selenodomain-associated transferase 2